MSATVLYSENIYPDDSVERRIYGPGVRVIFPGATAGLADLPDDACAAAEGLMILRYKVTAGDLARFPRLKAICRMGVGYDNLDRAAAAERGIMILNVPDYGTTEVADHAMALALSLRRGLLLHHDAQRANPAAPWRTIEDPLLRRSSVQTFGIVGMGRIATAVALRAKAFGFRVVFFDPYLPNGVELGLGVERAATLPELLRQTDTLSVHTPLTRETRGLLGLTELSLLPRDAVVVNTARGPIVDIDALGTLLKSGHLAGVGLDVVPVEPPVEPVPELMRAYRAREPWTLGRLIITPHSAFFTPEAWQDIRVKSAETMRAALLGPRPQNVIPPESD
ncbi:C-terminal binding protein [Rhodopila globiformis]|uniref:Phosphoglycerate dehydrogenase n=1 Tax=Rhodopila globiformis TaxID=1071 RepID=A0A2S6N3I5_RHOGL|nr:C-terminal binding protein [Rhodopila globiformis]PPQ29178.1 phosphoglycerate dehydrogenase [Rhodopila globiformis]